MYELEQEEKQPLDAIPDPRLRALYAYWENLRGERPMPSRQELDPHAFQQALGRINLIDVEAGDNGAKEYRHRLFGSLMGVIEGQDFTGRTVSEMPNPEYRSMLTHHYNEVVKLKRPTYYAIRGALDGKRYSYDRIILPLADDGENVTTLMVASFPHDPDISIR